MGLTVASCPQTGETEGILSFCLSIWGQKGECRQSIWLLVESFQVPNANPDRGWSSSTLGTSSGRSSPSLNFLRWQRLCELRWAVEGHCCPRRASCGGVGAGSLRPESTRQRDVTQHLCPIDKYDAMSEQDLECF